MYGYGLSGNERLSMSVEAVRLNELRREYDMKLLADEVKGTKSGRWSNMVRWVAKQLKAQFRLPAWSDRQAKGLQSVQSFER